MNKKSTQSNVDELQEVIASASYTNEEGNVIPAQFTDGGVTFVTLNGEVVTLPQVISASGARYANDDESLVFWNKGNEITLYQNGEIVFEGVDTTTSLESETEMSTNETTVSPISYLGSWKWVETVYPTDEGGAAPQPQSDKFIITFDADGKLSGTTDCNGFSGSYSVDSNNFISFGNGFVSILMYCEGSQENEFTTLLQKVQSVYQPDNSTLVLELPLDSGQIIFERQ